jgi:hypothetical protein
LAPNAQTRSTLNQLIRSSSTPQSLAPASRIVLAAADGSSNQHIVAEFGIYINMRKLPF